MNLAPLALLLIDPPSDYRAPAPPPPMAMPAAESDQASPRAVPPEPSVESGDVVVTARAASPADPLVAINAKAFEATTAVDDAVVAPIANAYTAALPAPVRDGIHNALSNLHEPGIAINFLLQMKPGKAIETIGRFAINSTIGLAGLFDVARRRPFRLPYRPNGFADTFGYYGIGPGPFLFLPIVGATTPRDLAGLVLDRLVLPLAVGRPFTRRAYTIPTGLLHTLDRRVAFDGDLRRTRAEGDPYVARRELYLRTRQAEIDQLRGRHQPAQ